MIFCPITILMFFDGDRTNHLEPTAGCSRNSLNHSFSAYYYDAICSGAPIHEPAIRPLCFCSSSSLCSNTWNWLSRLATLAFNVANATDTRSNYSSRNLSRSTTTSSCSISDWLLLSRLASLALNVATSPDKKSAFLHFLHRCSFWRTRCSLAIHMVKVRCPRARHI